MSANELAAKIRALTPEQRLAIESFINSLTGTAPRAQVDLTGHAAFGAWAGRQDLTGDSDAASRELRRRAAYRDLA